MRLGRIPATPHAIAASLLTVHAVLLLISIRCNFVTMDEAGHVVAGLSYVRTGRFLMYRVNPPLPKLLAVLPVLPMQPSADFGRLADDPLTRAEHVYGVAFTNENSGRIFDVVCRARLAGVAWSVCGGWIIYLWALRLYGGPGACLALALWCVEPYVLGHAGLVTADVPAAVSGVLASYAFWHFLRVPAGRRVLSTRRAELAGVALGVALLTKFTLLLLLPLWPAFWIADRWLEAGRGGLRGRLRPESGDLLRILLIALVVLNAGYLWRGTFRPLGDYPFISTALGGVEKVGGRPQRTGNRFDGTVLGRIPVPLPEDVLRGIDVQRVDFESRARSYLGGEWRREGWWYYYLYALAVKLPLGTIGLILWGIALVAASRGDRTRIRDELFLLATASGILAFVSSQTGFSLHSRYAIPALPYLLIIAGKSGRFLVGPGHRAARVVVWGLLLWAASASLRVYPHSLAYFNEIAGGPEHGHDHLLDSNIDWGQDLLYLKRWLREHPEAKPLGMAYFNSVDPRLMGIEYELPPPGPEAAEQSPGRPVGPLPGYYAISVNFLRGFEIFVHDGAGGVRDARPHEFEYFREFRPIARAGYSIYIYHITPEQADAVRRGRGLPTLAAAGP